ncbi:MAG: 30S ribosomal protein S20 [Oscillospiraceae bacterium]|nr:30S ribosomal protein S20 [Oscillospiraceae bacterium]
MANIKSSEKRIILSRKAAARNKAARSLMKTNIKKFDAAAQSGDQAAAESAHRLAVKTVDRAATNGLIHKNKAARRKSALAKQLNAVGQ